MICDNCKANVPEGFKFCGNCGQVLSGNSAEDILKRLARLEGDIQAESQLAAVDQKYLEIDTTERIASRLMKWAKMFAFCVGILIAIGVAILGLYWHSDIKSLNDVGERIDKSIKPALEKVENDSAQATATANDALGKSKQLAQEIGNTKKSLDALSVSIKDAQTKVATLQANVAASNDQIQSLRRQNANVMLAVDAGSIGQVYPTFGQHAVRATQGGYFDAKNKKPEDVYVGIAISLRTLTPDPQLQERASHFMMYLQNRGYRVFPPGPIFLDAVSNQTHQDIAEIDENSCIYLGHLTAPPCLLTFHTGNDSARIAILAAAKSVQSFPDDHVVYIDPSKVDALRQELLERSGLDFMVVFDAH